MQFIHLANVQQIFVTFILQLFDGCSCRFVVTDDFCQRLMLLWKITYQIVFFLLAINADAEIQLTFEAIFVNVIAMLVRPFPWGVYIPRFSLWQFCPFKCLSSDYNYNNHFLRYRLDPQLHDFKRWLTEFELKCSPPINRVYSVRLFNQYFSYSSLRFSHHTNSCVYVVQRPNRQCRIQGGVLQVEPSVPSATVFPFVVKKKRLNLWRGYSDLN